MRGSRITSVRSFSCRSSWPFPLESASPLSGDFLCLGHPGSGVSLPLNVAALALRCCGGRCGNTSGCGMGGASHSSLDRRRVKFSCTPGLSPLSPLPPRLPLGEPSAPVSSSWRLFGVPVLHALGLSSFPLACLAAAFQSPPFCAAISAVFFACSCAGQLRTKASGGGAAGGVLCLWAFTLCVSFFFFAGSAVSRFGACCA